MSNLSLSLVSVILIGLGASLTSDLWALFLNRAFKIPAPNYRLVGRWLRYIPEEFFNHSNIASTSPKSTEFIVGRIANYMIGITFSIAFVAIVGNC